MTRYVGTLGYFGDENFTWITRNGITKEDGAPHDLGVGSDIFLHKEDLTGLSDRGTTVVFDLVPDQKRGEGHFRAMNAVQYVGQNGLEWLQEGDISLTPYGEKGAEIEHSTLFVSWRLSRALIEQAKKLTDDGQTVRLLLVTWKEGMRRKTEKRQLLDIANPPAYVAFGSGGPQRMVAILVHGGTENRLQDEYFARSGNAFDTTVIGSSDDRIILRDGWFGRGYRRIDIPESLFLKRPKDWEWVNRWFRSEPRDRCAYRWRRALVGYTTQPVVLGLKGALFFLAGVIALFVLLLLGFSGFDLGEMKHPIDGQVSNAWYDIRRTIFVPKIRGINVYVPLIFSPIVIALAFVAGAILSGQIGTHLWWTRSLDSWLLALLGLVVGTVVDAYIDHLQSAAFKKSRAEAKREQARLELDRLLSEGMSARPSSFDWRTVVFWTRLAKQRACKAYADA